ncbi:MAG: GNAT family N-acetyltransferase [Pseudomonadota bacterium]
MSAELPVLTTERLTLVPPGVACWDAYRQFYTDEAASKMYGGPLSVSAAWERLASDLGAWHLQGFGVWVIQRRREQDFVGTCGFWQGKGWPRELTWWLLPVARGSGIATEASRAAIDFAYDSLNWSSVETYMNDDNDAARVGGATWRTIHRSTYVPGWVAARCLLVPSV